MLHVNPSALKIALSASALPVLLGNDCSTMHIAQKARSRMQSSRWKQEPWYCTLQRYCVAMQGSDKQSEVRIKKFMTMMDSMTEFELNTNEIKVLQQPTRVARISKGAGRRPEDYFELLGECSILPLFVHNRGMTH